MKNGKNEVKIHFSTARCSSSLICHVNMLNLFTRTTVWSFKKSLNDIWILTTRSSSSSINLTCKHAEFVERS